MGTTSVALLFLCVVSFFVFAQLLRPRSPVVRRVSGTIRPQEHSAHKARAPRPVALPGESQNLLLHDEPTARLWQAVRLSRKLSRRYRPKMSALPTSFATCHDRKFERASGRPERGERAVRVGNSRAWHLGTANAAHELRSERRAALATQSRVDVECYLYAQHSCVLVCSALVCSFAFISLPSLTPPQALAAGSFWGAGSRD